MFCNESSQFYVTKKNRIYCFNKNSIPVEAIITNNYKEFRHIILERLSDITLQIRSIMRTLETETAIVRKNAANLTERDIKTIHHYINKLHLDLEGLIPIQEDLRKLQENENVMAKLFAKRRVFVFKEE
jgi:hypothetical protein